VCGDAACQRRRRAYYHRQKIAADEMRLGLRRAAYRTQYARAFHNMRGEARRPPTTRTGEESQARPPGPANALRLALWLQTHG
jgi:hypothetical protein